jgi:D-alanyl-D-alanine carboxypeptidase
VLPAGGRITVTELLQQRSGLPDFTGTPQVGSVSRSAVTRVWTSRELLRTIAGRRLDFAPGTQFEYSNSNYLMLGLLIERVTRMPLERYAERTIFAPLQMRSTSFALGRVPGAHAHGYESQGPPFPAVPGGLRDVDVGNGSEWAAAGSLVSTAADLDRFFRALFTGRIIPRPLVVLMQATRLAQEGLGFDGYGLGLEATRTGCGTALGHGGSVWGYRAIVRASRTAEHVIVLLVNYDYSDLAGRAAVDRAGSALYCAR